MNLLKEPEALAEFADRKRLRPDWHEPDEQGLVGAMLVGDILNNAHDGWLREAHIVLKMDDGEEVVVNLCNLLAWASAGLREQ